MTTIITALNLILVIIGLATIIRYLAYRINCCSDCECHHIILLRNENAEMQLRSAIERDRHDMMAKNRKIYAVDMGIDSQTADICRKMSLDYSQIIFCLPEQLQKLL